MDQVEPFLAKEIVGKADALRRLGDDQEGIA
jgi:hypothetical protein